MRHHTAVCFEELSMKFDGIIHVGIFYKVGFEIYSVDRYRKGLIHV